MINRIFDLDASRSHSEQKNRKKIDSKKFSKEQKEISGNSSLMIERRKPKSTGAEVVKKN